VIRNTLSARHWGPQRSKRRRQDEVPSAEKIGDDGRDIGLLSDLSGDDG
jgi:hypothetical protein